MKLDSVRSLKGELLSIPRTLVTSLAATRAFSAFADNREAADRTMLGIALGVAVKGKEYQLAVRLQQTGPLVTAMTERIRKRAKGEVDIAPSATAATADH
jgi:hypothetical protein